MNIACVQKGCCPVTWHTHDCYRITRYPAYARYSGAGASGGCHLRCVYRLIHRFVLDRSILWVGVLIIMAVAFAHWGYLKGLLWGRLGKLIASCLRPLFVSLVTQ